MPVASLRVLFSTLFSCFSSNDSRQYYAVRIGRQGPRLYDNYPEFAAATLGLSGSSGKRFDNIHDAEGWLTGYLIPMASIQTNMNVNLNVSDGTNVSAATPTPTPTLSVPQQAFSNDSAPGLNGMQGLSRERAEGNDGPSVPVGEPVVEELSKERAEVQDRPPVPVGEPAVEGLSRERAEGNDGPSVPVGEPAVEGVSRERAEGNDAPSIPVGEPAVEGVSRERAEENDGPSNPVGEPAVEGVSRERDEGNDDPSIPVGEPAVEGVPRERDEGNDDPSIPVGEPAVEGVSRERAEGNDVPSIPVGEPAVEGVSRERAEGNDGPSIPVGEPAVEGLSRERADGPSIPVGEPTVKLSDEQDNILQMVKSGKNIFFTGAAGTGKSVLLRAIICYLRSVYEFDFDFGITAPTGIAGLNIGGQTIHSWAGIGLGKEPLDTLKLRLNSRSIDRWTAAKALIIDEISMLDGRLFDKLEAIARFVRKDSRPFGGIQLIASGDFFQLPPVPEQDLTSRIEATFAFQAESWHQCIDHRMRLTKVFHQKDNTFIEILASMRTGVLLKWHIEEFRKLSREIHYDDGISPTQLFPLKAQVKQHNLQCLGKLEGETRVYKAMDARGHDSDGERLTINQAETLLEKLVCPKEVPLKVGAQVMLLRNMSQSLVNGSLGKVVEFIGIPEAQQRDIAISELERRNTGEVLTVNSPDARDNEAGLIALDGHTFSKDQSWPLVQFTNGERLLCSPVEFVVKGLTGNVEARRLQIPLALSWAMSIHKSQGQTFSRVKVDLARIFEKGQAYVAISRATCMEGLEIVNFSPDKVMAHPKVIEWQKQWDKDRYQEEEMDNGV